MDQRKRNKSNTSDHWSLRLFHKKRQRNTRRCFHELYKIRNKKYIRINYRGYRGVNKQRTFWLGTALNESIN